MTQENKINIAELLKDCPKGMELDCSMFENLELNHIDKDDKVYPIKCRVKTEHDSYNYHSFNKYGCYGEEKYYKCVIFPKGKTTWEGFHRPFKDGEVVVCDNPHREYLQIFIFKDKIENNALSTCYLMLDGDELVLEEDAWYVTRIATEEEKQKLFDAIKANGYKWNAETKTLDKLITPNKFDITTLKPFDKVLVRCSSLERWHIDFFEAFDGKNKYPFTCLHNNKYGECIPYGDNEHLLGTTNDCDEYYKTWE